MQRWSEDLRSLERDAEKRKAGETGYAFKASGVECPPGVRCEFKDGTCTFCQLRDAPDPNLGRLDRIMAQIAGGMPVARHELSAIEWEWIGRMRLRAGRIF